MSSQFQPVRFAVVGLGHIAVKAILPAFERSSHAVAAAAVSGSGGEKAAAAGFSFPRVYAYDELETAIEAEKIDAVYLAVPNHLHRPFAELAFAAGAHVLSEKPLGASLEDGQAMVESARKAGKKLMVGLRLDYGLAHRAALSLAHAGTLGSLRSFHSVFTVQVRPGNTRTRRAEGGGPLLDLGIYCIHAARKLFQSEPERVFALATTRPGDHRFAEVPEMFSALLEFPEACLATFTCSFGSTRVMNYDILGTEGAVHLDPAYDYASDIRFTSVIGGDRQENTYPQQDQFAAQIDHFAACIRENSEPLTSGEDGLFDLEIAAALEQSAASNTPVNLRDFTSKR